MSNNSNNRISVTLTEDAVNNIKVAVNHILDAMPFLIGLTPEERKSIPKINDSNKTFTEDGVKAINNNLHMLPAYFLTAEINNDLVLFNQLDEVDLIISQLSEKIKDTKMLAGSEAYVSALTAYRLFDAAAKAGVPGADAVNDLLKERFAEQGNAGTANKAVTSENPQ
jgi:hypothetical protein